MTAPRILVLDDDPKIRKLYERALTQEGYAVITAATAEEALTAIRESRPSALLVDLKMPFVNGAGFLFRLREDPSGRDVPVAVITGVSNVDEETQKDLSELRARVWHKPLTPAEIVQVARTLLAPGS
ncbi:MAG TPA: response regulator [Vicinamibacterales bacterium]|nr:response regulator [Vicinamibacterales bacterium]